MTMLRSVYTLGAWVRSLIHARQGNVAIEFAFIAPVVILLTLAAVELGRVGTEWTRVKHAAHAGTQFGIQDQANAANAQGMVDAARFDADDSTNELEISARRYCRCPGTTAEVACSEKCPDDTFSPMYVEVNVSQDIAALIPYLDLPKSYAISAQNTGRVR